MCIRDSVSGARERQLARLAGTGAYANAHMSARPLRRLCSLETDATALLDPAAERLRLSARAYDRVIKVAQTIADLEAAPTITSAHVAESLSYRNRSHHDR